jgi:hypothetical protein
MTPRLEQIVDAVADALEDIDASGVAFRNFLPGVGPYGEPQLLSEIAKRLNINLPCGGGICTRRTPDLLIPGLWAIECKIARPYGDNGKPAENWSVNLLHPYSGNTSLIGDCLKLQSLPERIRKAVVAIGYEHTPPRITLEPLFASFELLARGVVGIRLGDRVEVKRQGLVHPVHQQLAVAAWEVLGTS